MPISCFSTGRSLFKSLEQNVTLGSMLLLFLLLIISPILGMATYNYNRQYDNDLCKDFGINKLESDNEISILLFIIFSIVCFVLASMSGWYVYKQRINNLEFITPVIFLIIGISLAVIASQYDNQTIIETTGVVDGKVREWCYKENVVSKRLNIAMGSFLAINTAVFVGWITSVIANSCVIY